MTGRRVLLLVENESVPHDRRVTEEARALVEAGYTVSVICPADEGEPLCDEVVGAHVRRYRPYVARGGAVSQILEYLVALGKTFWLMLRLVRRPGFDVIHACNPPDLFPLISWPFTLAGKRFIFDQHDLSPELYAALYGRDDGLVMGALRLTERMSYRLADVVIATNESYRRIACSRGGVDPDRVFVVRNGPREGWPRSVACDPALRNGRRYLVVYMGVMGFQDGVDVLLDAAAHLVHDLGFEDVTFALVGDGDAVASLRKQCARLGLDDRVVFTGWLYDEDMLSRYVVSADVCVCPESSSPLNDHSTFIKVMEYLASSTPVVAFDLPETRFSAQDAAAYAKSGDVPGFARQIRRVLTDATFRDSLVEAAERRTPELRWERQVPELLAAYERAFDTR